MKLVSADTPYSAGKSDLSVTEHELSKAAFEIIQAFRMEVSEHDEDPEFDFDDALSAIVKSAGFGRTLAAHFMGDPNIPKEAEAIGHGVMRNLGVLDEKLIVRTEPAIPGVQVTEDTPTPPPVPEPEPDKEPKPKKGRGRAVHKF